MTDRGPWQPESFGEYENADEHREKGEEGQLREDGHREEHARGRAHDEMAPRPASLEGCQDRSEEERQADVVEEDHPGEERERRKREQRHRDEGLAFVRQETSC